MFVCNCNGLRCKQVDEAIAAGAEAPRDVYAHHGCEVRCARCVPEIAERIERARRAATQAPALLQQTA